MKVSDSIDILEKQFILERTPKGRSITDYALEAINAALCDEKNHDSEVFQCKNCKYINSGLLYAEGCPNCGSKDLEMNITEEDIL